MSVHISELQYKLADDLISELGLKDKEIAEVEKEIESSQNDKDYFVTLDLVYYGEPKPSPRARYNSKHNMFFDSSVGLKQAVIEQVIRLLPANFKPYTTYMEFQATYYLPLRKSASKKEKVLAELGLIRPTKKPDVDNLDKLLYDALIGILYVDDCIIVGGDSKKYYSCKPRVEIKLKIKS